MLYDNQSPPTVLEKPKEKPAKYDLFKDYYRSDTGQPDNYWCWNTWNNKFYHNVPPSRFKNKEDFYFHNKEIDCTVPEPAAIGMVITGCLVALLAKHRMNT